MLGDIIEDEKDEGTFQTSTRRGLSRQNSGIEETGNENRANGFSGGLSSKSNQAKQIAVQVKVHNPIDSVKEDPNEDHYDLEDSRRSILNNPRGRGMIKKNTSDINLRFADLSANDQTNLLKSDAKQPLMKSF